MLRKNFPHRRLKKKLEAEARNARTPVERTKKFRLKKDA